MRSSPLAVYGKAREKPGNRRRLAATGVDRRAIGSFQFSRRWSQAEDRQDLRGELILGDNWCIFSEMK